MRWQLVDLSRLHSLCLCFFVKKASLYQLVWHVSGGHTWQLSFPLCLQASFYTCRVHPCLHKHSHECAHGKRGREFEVTTYDVVVLQQACISPPDPRPSCHSSEFRKKVHTRRRCMGVMMTCKTTVRAHIMTMSMIMMTTRQTSRIPLLRLSSSPRSLSLPSPPSSPPFLLSVSTYLPIHLFTYLSRRSCSGRWETYNKVVVVAAVAGKRSGASALQLRRQDGGSSAASADPA